MELGQSNARPRGVRARSDSQRRSVHAQEQGPVRHWGLGSVFSGIGHVASNVGKAVAKGVTDVGHVAGSVASNPLVQAGLGATLGPGAAALAGGVGHLIGPGGNIGNAVGGAISGGAAGAAGGMLRNAIGGGAGGLAGALKAGAGTLLGGGGYLANTLGDGTGGGGAGGAGGGGGGGVSPAVLALAGLQAANAADLGKTANDYSDKAWNTADKSYTDRAGLRSAGIAGMLSPHAPNLSSLAAIRGQNPIAAKAGVGVAPFAPPPSRALEMAGLGGGNTVGTVVGHAGSGDSSGGIGAANPAPPVNGAGSHFDQVITGVPASLPNGEGSHLARVIANASGGGFSGMVAGIPGAASREPGGISSTVTGAPGTGDLAGMGHFGPLMNGGFLGHALSMPPGGNTAGSVVGRAGSGDSGGGIGAATPAPGGFGGVLAKAIAAGGGAPSPAPFAPPSDGGGFLRRAIPQGGATAAQGRFSPGMAA